MNKPWLKHLMLMLLGAAIAACGTDGGEFGPTIADLDDEIKFESIGELGGFHMEVEPQATFEVSQEPDA